MTPQLLDRSAYIEAVLATEPTAYWPLNGRTDDPAGGHDLTLAGSCSFEGPGPIEGEPDCLEFGGSSSDKASSPTAPAVGLQFSLAFWMRPAETGAPIRIKDGSGNSVSVGWYFGRWLYVTLRVSGFEPSRRQTSEPWNASVWTHVVLGKSDTGAETTGWFFYLDAVADGQSAPAKMGEGPTGVVIGEATNSGFAHVAYFDRVLTADESRHLYLAGRNGAF